MITKTQHAQILHDNATMVGATIEFFNSTIVVLRGGRVECNAPASIKMSPVVATNWIDVFVQYGGTVRTPPSV